MAKLTTELKRARAELDHLEGQLARLEARTAGKRTEVARLERAIAQEAARDRPAPPVEVPVEVPVEKVTAPPTVVTVEQDRPALPSRRTDAVVEVLRRAADPMSPTEIADVLNEHGRDDQLRSVTATLAHLLKAKQVRRVGRGRYVAS